MDVMTEFALSTMVLSGKDLANCRRRKQSKTGRPHKNSKITDTKLLAELREFYYNLDKSHLAWPIIDRKKDFTKGTVIGSTTLVLLDKSRVTVLPHMGINCYGGKCLYPEETLYMMHKGRIMVYYEEVCISIQAAVALLINNEHYFKRYIVYNQLGKFGLRLHCNNTYIETQSRPDSVGSCEESDCSSKRTRTESCDSLNDVLESKKSKLEFPSSKNCPDNISVQNVSFKSSDNYRTSQYCVDALDFDVRWDYSNFSTDVILEKFCNEPHKKEHIAKRNAFTDFPCLIDDGTATFTVPDVSLLGPDWVPPGNKVYIITKDSISLPHQIEASNGADNCSDILLNPSKTDQREVPHFTNSLMHPSNLNASLVKISHSWMEYRAAEKYLLAEKLKNRPLSDILWKGKTKPLINNYCNRNVVSLKLKSTVEDEGYLETDGFSGPTPCYDVYSRTCKGESSTWPPPLVRVSIPKDELVSHRQLIGSACESNLSVSGCCSVSFRLISLFKYRATNEK